MASYTPQDVAAHNKDGDAWVVIEGKVYDVSSFLAAHPGGKALLLKNSGKDITGQFKKFHNAAEVIAKHGPRLYIGELTTASSAKETPKESSLTVIKPSSFGGGVSYGDPNWYQEWHSPYYQDSHRRVRAAMREFVEREIIPFCFEWDEAKKVPMHIYKKCFEAGWLPSVVGSPWPTEYAGATAIGGVPASEWDYFHELIVIDELCRCGSGGVIWALFEGLQIGLPPVLQWASKALRDRVAGPCIRGEKFICLCITEPQAGSDVARIQTSAKKTPCGKFYIVNGEKKWITNGVFSDYFTVAVRTGGPGMGGISLLLIERAMPGVTTRQMQCSGMWSSGTTFITFEDVKVPVENLIGTENEGFKCVMTNFNHERWGFVVQGNRLARVVTEEAIAYAHKRKTFGKRLIDHPVIRMKIAHMARQVESTHAWLENVTFQLCNMSNKNAMSLMAGPIALLKAQSTQTLEFCAREAAQIFGGLSYTRGGQGERIERIYREVRAYAIPAGSEEIMLDLGVRQVLKRSNL